MKFKFEDESAFMNHLLLESRGLATSVSKTKLWTESETLEATLQINGVDVPAEHLESFMKSLWDRAVEQLRTRYKADDFDRQVEEKAKQLLKSHADNALDKLYDLTSKLEGIEDTIKPYRERDNG